MIWRSCFSVSHLCINMRSDLRCNTSPHLLLKIRYHGCLHTLNPRELCVCAQPAYRLWQHLPSLTHWAPSSTRTPTTPTSSLARTRTPSPNNLVNLLVENPLGPPAGRRLQGPPISAGKNQSHCGFANPFLLLCHLEDFACTASWPARSRMCSHLAGVAPARLCYTLLTRHQACHAFSSHCQQGCVPVCTA